MKERNIEIICLTIVAVVACLTLLGGCYCIEKSVQIKAITAAFGTKPATTTP